MEDGWGIGEAVGQTNDRGGRRESLAVVRMFQVRESEEGHYRLKKKN